MTRYFILLVVFSFTLSGYGQDGASSDIFTMVTTPSNGGKITLIQDQSINKLVKTHLESNSRNETIDGFRLQLYSGSSKKAKADAVAAKSKMLSMFPDVPVYLEYNAPFWRVRAGDFRSKNESMELYSKIKASFPESYPVKDSQVNYNRIQDPLNDGAN